MAAFQILQRIITDLVHREDLHPSLNALPWTLPSIDRERATFIQISKNREEQVKRLVAFALSVLVYKYTKGTEIYDQVYTAIQSKIVNIDQAVVKKYSAEIQAIIAFLLRNENNSRAFRASVCYLDEPLAPPPPDGHEEKEDEHERIRKLSRYTGFLRVVARHEDYSTSFSHDELAEMDEVDRRFFEGGLPVERLTLRAVAELAASDSNAVRVRQAQATDLTKKWLVDQDIRLVLHVAFPHCFVGRERYFNCSLGDSGHRLMVTEPMIQGEHPEPLMGQIERLSRQARALFPDQYPYTIILPVNLANDAHWTALKIEVKSANETEVEYFDSLGKPSDRVMSQLESGLRGHFFGLHIISNNRTMQQDGYRCGDWVVYKLLTWANEAGVAIEDANVRGIIDSQQANDEKGNHQSNKIRLSIMKAEGVDRVQRPDSSRITSSDTGSDAAGPSSPSRSEIDSPRVSSLSVLEKSSNSSTPATDHLLRVLVDRIKHKSAVQEERMPVTSLAAEREQAYRFLADKKVKQVTISIDSHRSQSHVFLIEVAARAVVEGDEKLRQAVFGASDSMITDIERREKRGDFRAFCANQRIKKLIPAEIPPSIAESGDPSLASLLLSTAIAEIKQIKQETGGALLKRPDISGIIDSWNQQFSDYCHKLDSMIAKAHEKSTFQWLVERFTERAGNLEERYRQYIRLSEQREALRSEINELRGSLNQPHHPDEINVEIYSDDDLKARLRFISLMSEDFEDESLHNDIDRLLTSFDIEIARNQLPNKVAELFRLYDGPDEIQKRLASLSLIQRMPLEEDGPLAQIAKAVNENQFSQAMTLALDANLFTEDHLNRLFDDVARFVAGALYAHDEIERATYFSTYEKATDRKKWLKDQMSAPVLGAFFTDSPDLCQILNNYLNKLDSDVDKQWRVGDAGGSYFLTQEAKKRFSCWIDLLGKQKNVARLESDIEKKATMELRAAAQQVHDLSQTLFDRFDKIKVSRNSDIAHARNYFECIRNKLESTSIQSIKGVLSEKESVGTDNSSVQISFSDFYKHRLPNLTKDNPGLFSDTETEAFEDQPEIKGYQAQRKFYQEAGLGLGWTLEMFAPFVSYERVGDQRKLDQIKTRFFQFYNGQLSWSQLYLYLVGLLGSIPASEENPLRKAIALSILKLLSCLSIKEDNEIRRMLSAQLDTLTCATGLDQSALEGFTGNIPQDYLPLTPVLVLSKEAVINVNNAFFAWRGAFVAKLEDLEKKIASSLEDGVVDISFYTQLKTLLEDLRSDLSKPNGGCQKLGDFLNELRKVKRTSSPEERSIGAQYNELVKALESMEQKIESLKQEFLDDAPPVEGLFSAYFSNKTSASDKAEILANLPHLNVRLSNAEKGECKLLVQRPDFHDMRAVRQFLVASKEEVFRKELIQDVSDRYMRAFKSYLDIFKIETSDHDSKKDKKRRLDKLFERMSALYVLKQELVGDDSIEGQDFSFIHSMLTGLLFNIGAQGNKAIIDYSGNPARKNQVDRLFDMLLSILKGEKNRLGKPMGLNDLLPLMNEIKEEVAKKFRGTKSDLYRFLTMHMSELQALHAKQLSAMLDGAVSSREYGHKFLPDPGRCPADIAFGPQKNEILAKVEEKLAHPSLKRADSASDLLKLERGILALYPQTEEIKGLRHASTTLPRIVERYFRAKPLDPSTAEHTRESFQRWMSELDGKYDLVNQQLFSIIDTEGFMALRENGSLDLYLDYLTKKASDEALSAKSAVIQRINEQLTTLLQDIQAHPLSEIHQRAGSELISGRFHVAGEIYPSVSNVAAINALGAIYLVSMQKAAEPPKTSAELGKAFLFFCDIEAKPWYETWSEQPLNLQAVARETEKLAGYYIKLLLQEGALNKLEEYFASTFGLQIGSRQYQQDQLKGLVWKQLLVLPALSGESYDRFIQTHLVDYVIRHLGVDERNYWKEAEYLLQHCTPKQSLDVHRAMINRINGLPADQVEQQFIQYCGLSKTVGTGGLLDKRFAIDTFISSVNEVNLTGIHLDRWEPIFNALCEAGDFAGLATEKKLAFANVIANKFLGEEQQRKIARIIGMTRLSALLKDDACWRGDNTVLDNGLKAIYQEIPAAYRIEGAESLVDFLFAGDVGEQFKLALRMAYEARQRAMNENQVCALLSENPLVEDREPPPESGVNLINLLTRRFPIVASGIAAPALSLLESNVREFWERFERDVKALNTVKEGEQYTLYLTTRDLKLVSCLSDEYKQKLINIINESQSSLSLPNAHPVSNLLSLLKLTVGKSIHALSNDMIVLIDINQKMLLLEAGQSIPLIREIRELRLAWTDEGALVSDVNRVAIQGELALSSKTEISEGAKRFLQETYRRLRQPNPIQSQCDVILGQARNEESKNDFDSYRGEFIEKLFHLIQSNSTKDLSLRYSDPIVRSLGTRDQKAQLENVYAAEKALENLASMLTNHVSEFWTPREEMTFTDYESAFKLVNLDGKQAIQKVVEKQFTDVFSYFNKILDSDFSKKPGEDEQEAFFLEAVKNLKRLSEAFSSYEFMRTLEERLKYFADRLANRLLKCLYSESAVFIGSENSASSNNIDNKAQREIVANRIISSYLILEHFFADHPSMPILHQRWKMIRLYYHQHAIYHRDNPGRKFRYNTVERANFYCNEPDLKLGVVKLHSDYRKLRSKLSEHKSLCSTAFIKEPLFKKLRLTALGYLVEHRDLAFQELRQFLVDNKVEFEQPLLDILLERREFSQISANIQLRVQTQDEAFLARLGEIGKHLEMLEQAERTLCGKISEKELVGLLNIRIQETKLERKIFSNAQTSSLEAIMRAMDSCKDLAAEETKPVREMEALVIEYIKSGLFFDAALHLRALYYSDQYRESVDLSAIKEIIDEQLVSLCESDIFTKADKGEVLLDTDVLEAIGLWKAESNYVENVKQRMNSADSSRRLLVSLITAMNAAGKIENIDDWRALKVVLPSGPFTLSVTPEAKSRLLGMLDARIFRPGEEPWLRKLREALEKILDSKTYSDLLAAIERFNFELSPPILNERKLQVELHDELELPRDQLPLDVPALLKKLSLGKAFDRRYCEKFIDEHPNSYVLQQWVLERINNGAPFVEAFVEALSHKLLGNDDRLAIRKITAACLEDDGLVTFDSFAEKTADEPSGVMREFNSKLEKLSARKKQKHKQAVFILGKLGAIKEKTTNPATQLLLIQQFLKAQKLEGDGRKLQASLDYVTTPFQVFYEALKIRLDQKVSPTQSPFAEAECFTAAMVDKYLPEQGDLVSEANRFTFEYSARKLQDLLDESQGAAAETLGIMEEFAKEAGVDPRSERKSSLAKAFATCLFLLEKLSKEQILFLLSMLDSPNHNGIMQKIGEEFACFIKQELPVDARPDYDKWVRYSNARLIYAARELKRCADDVNYLDKEEILGVCRYLNPPYQSGFRIPAFVLDCIVDMAVHPETDPRSSPARGLLKGLILRGDDSVIDFLGRKIGTQEPFAQGAFAIFTDLAKDPNVGNRLVNYFSVYMEKRCQSEHNPAGYKKVFEKMSVCLPVLANLQPTSLSAAAFEEWVDLLLRSKQVAEGDIATQEIILDYAKRLSEIPAVKAIPQDNVDLLRLRNLINPEGSALQVVRRGLGAGPSSHTPRPGRRGSPPSVSS